MKRANTSTNALVYAQPDNQDARYLCADALEQLGYQAESGAWRNAYLTAAFDLRHGTDLYPKTSVGGQSAAAFGMSTETMLDCLGICLDNKEMEDVDLVINLKVTDEDAQYLLRIHHGVLLHSKEAWSSTPDAVIRTKRAGILGIAQGNTRLMESAIQSVEGNEDVLQLLTSHLMKFDAYFNIIEP